MLMSSYMQSNRPKSKLEHNVEFLTDIQPRGHFREKSLDLQKKNHKKDRICIRNKRAKKHKRCSWWERRRILNGTQCIKNGSSKENYEIWFQNSFILHVMWWKPSSLINDDYFVKISLYFFVVWVCERRNMFPVLKVSMLTLDRH